MNLSSGDIVGNLVGRRKVIHEEIYQTPSATHLLINRFISDLGIVPVRGTTTHITSRNAAITLKAPPPDYCKIHVDASVA